MYDITTDPAAKVIITTFTYHCSGTIQETLSIVEGYLRNDLERLKKQLNDVFRLSYSRVYTHTRSYLERLCQDQLDSGNIGQKAFIRACDNISRIMIDNGALAEYSQVEMLLRVLPKELTAEAVTKLELDHRDFSRFK